MTAKLKHIILACTNPAERQLPVSVNGQSSLDITVVVSSKQFGIPQKGPAPDLIIIMRQAGVEDSGDNFLQAIRKNDHFDETPVFVYTIMPGKNDLAEWLEIWQKALSHFPL